jgi:hypothetical protein
LTLREHVPGSMVCAQTMPYGYVNGDEYAHAWLEKTPEYRRLCAQMAPEKKEEFRAIIARLADNYLSKGQAIQMDQLCIVAIAD